MYAVEYYIQLLTTISVFGGALAIPTTPASGILDSHENVAQGTFLWPKIAQMCHNLLKNGILILFF